MTPTVPPRSARPPRRQLGMAALALGALGVVFGDIGTSPLYALQTVFSADHGAVKPTEQDVFGVISLVFWSITLIVSIEFVLFIMRADNEGEGGILALIAKIETTKLDAQAGEVRADRDRHVRRRPLLRRRDDHPGDLGPLGGRRGEGGRAEHPRAWWCR